MVGVAPQTRPTPASQYPCASFVENLKYGPQNLLVEFSPPQQMEDHTMPPHIEIVFRALFEELRSMKQQQWTITNYEALILGAIYVVKLPGV